MRDLKDLIHALTAVIVDYHQLSTKQSHTQTEWHEQADAELVEWLNLTHVPTSTSSFQTSENLTRLIDEATASNTTRLNMLLYLKSVITALITLAQTKEIDAFIDPEESKQYSTQAQSEIVDLLKTLHKLYYHTPMRQTLSVNHADQCFALSSFDSGFGSTSSKLSKLVHTLILKPLDITQHTDGKNLELQAQNVWLQHKNVMLTECLARILHENNARHEKLTSTSSATQTDPAPQPTNQNFLYRMFDRSSATDCQSEAPQSEAPQSKSFYTPITGFGYGDFDL